MPTLVKEDVHEGPLSYKLVRGWFFLCSRFFYNIEVYGLENMPPSGPSMKNATILCANHGNSLADAILVVSSSPCFTRLTAKDSLWKDPFFGWLVRAVGTLPIQRKTEHGNAADNTRTMKALYDALEDGGVVALFPEGISRYMSGIAPMKLGVGHMVLTILERKEAVGEDFCVNVVPVGITYLHREKFRSDVAVSFEKPLTFRPSQYQEMIADGGTQAAAKRIMNAVSKALWSSTLSAIDWDIMRAAIIARRLYVPSDTTMSLYQHLKMTRAFLNALSSMEETERYGRLLRRSMSDPDVPTLGSAQPEDAQLAAGLKKDLLDYEAALETLGVSDEILSRGQFYWRKRLAVRSFCRSTIYLSLAFPGTVLLTPILCAGKLSELLVVRFNRGEKRIRNVDEVAQWKLLTGAPLTTMMVTVGVVLLKRFMPMLLAILVVPLWFLASVAMLEAGIVSLNTCYSAVCAIIRQKRIPPLLKVRENLTTRVKVLAKKLDIPPPEKFMVGNGADVHKGSPSFLFRRWKKRNWGEVMRIGDRGTEIYPEKMLKKHPLPGIALLKKDQ